ncbi:hypothetical protein M501DRAFT_1003355 [Patellaria atrata CBS 101060]|uniref:Pre-rRNA-processing protein n=1 Tax=Patellaria atrata CBS 101060 TaxID=1346257 RepID=A0A9P4SDL3_9PEZI|nr:hypothetical protein M501DRAFT_1003355 [Patellaria atrata CBS 101060]
MGSSAKKKKEKKKDFAKAKLKVGKTKPKASNFTDTSFKAKSVVLKEQSISTTAPSLTSQFSHHLSLLTHKSDSQRKESLAYLTTAIKTRPPDSPLPQPIAIIIPKVQPLIVDGSKGVREQLLKVLQVLPPEGVANHVEQLLLYTRAGMTHLSADIRYSSIDVLDWSLRVAGQELVGSVGGWVRTLKTFLSLLGWQAQNTGKWTAARTTTAKAGSEGKVFVRQLNGLASFLRAGLGKSSSEDVKGSTHSMWPFPLCQSEYHMLSSKYQGFDHLNLFGAPRDEDNEMYEDREDRQRIFLYRFEPAISAGLETARKEGGEVGRAAAAVRKAITEGMRGYDQD